MLDAAHIGALINQALIDAYLAAYADPEQEFSWREIWIVGPTAAATFRLRRTIDA